MYSGIPYSRKYWQELNLGVGALNRYCKNIGGFKFGGSVRDPYICIYASIKFWRNLIWRSQIKPPTLIPQHIFWLYGIIGMYVCLIKSKFKKHLLRIHLSLAYFALLVYPLLIMKQELLCTLPSRERT